MFVRVERSLQASLLGCRTGCVIVIREYLRGPRPMVRRSHPLSLRPHPTPPHRLPHQKFLPLHLTLVRTITTSHFPKDIATK